MAVTLAIVLASAALLVFWFIAYGPGGLRAAYTRDVDRALARLAPVTQVVAEAYLAHLPAAIGATCR
jgi:hypothetical protein